MVLFSNSYFQLNYDPATDVLFVKLPDMSASGLSEARHCFEIMVDCVKNYHIRNLLLDSSHANVQVDDAEYHSLIYQVSISLKHTKLKKVARVVSNLPKLEKLAVKVQSDVTDSPPVAYQIKNFQGQQQALTWLTN